jgi:hypothetical protein
MALAQQILVASLAALGTAQRPRPAVFVIFAAAVLLVLIAAVFAIVGLYGALADMLSPPQAAGLTAAILLFLAALLFLFAVLLSRRPPEPPAEVSLDSEKLAEAVMAVSRLTERVFRQSSPTLGAVAILAGFAVSYSPGLRRFLKNLLVGKSS